MPSRRLSGERGRDAPRKAHLLGVPAEGLRAVLGVSEATCDSLAWWDAVWQERDAHHRNWNGVTYVGAYRPLPPAARATYLLLRCQYTEPSYVGEKSLERWRGVWDVRSAMKEKVDQ